MLYCRAPESISLADVSNQHRRVAHRLKRHCVHRFRVGELAVGVDVEVPRSDAHVSCRENQVGTIHRRHHVVEAQVARLHLERIDIDLNLAIGSPIGLRHRCALDVRDLVAYLELRQILQVRFVQALAFQSHKADWLRRGIHAQHHRRQRSWREAAQVGHGQVGNVAQGRVWIGAWFEVDLDEAHARQ